MAKIGGPTGLQIWSALVSQALSTLAASTALNVDTTFNTGMKAGALLKNLHMEVGWFDGIAQEGPIMVGLCQGDLTVAEIASAFTDNSLDPYDHTGSLATLEKLGILWESLMVIVRQEEEGIKRLKVSLGGGKGIPVGEDKGFKLFAMNLDGSALTTGSAIRGFYRVQGVWLGD